MTVLPMGVKTLLFAAILGLAPWARAEVTLTVYQGGGQLPSLGGGAIGDPGGFAVVGRILSTRLPAGPSHYRLDDVPERLDPTSVRLSATDPDSGLQVLEQAFDAAPASAQALLAANIDRRVRVEVPGDGGGATVEGLLRHAGEGQLVIEGLYGTVQVLREYSRIEFPEQPLPLASRARLGWLLQSPAAGEQELALTYHTEGIGWWIDYHLSLDGGGGDCRLSLGAWVTLANASGADYVDAQLKLVAGDVRRERAAPAHMAVLSQRAVAEDATAGFETGALGEHHVYRLDRRATLPDRSLRQLELFPAIEGLECERRYRVTNDPGFFGVRTEPFLERLHGGEYSEQPVPAELAFGTADSGGPDRALPAGRMRVHERDADGATEFVGEARIGHTPRGAPVRISLGAAFDLRASRSLQDFRLDRARRTLEEDVEVVVRNAREHPVDVEIVEAQYRWSRWEIVESTHEAQPMDAGRALFVVEAAPREETTLRYTVRYRW